MSINVFPEIFGPFSTTQYLLGICKNCKAKIDTSEESRTFQSNFLSIIADKLHGLDWSKYYGTWRN